MPHGIPHQFVTAPGVLAPHTAKMAVPRARVGARGGRGLPPPEMGVQSGGVTSGNIKKF